MELGKNAAHRCSSTTYKGNKPMSNATRKHVRAAIVATAATFAELRKQWSVREDLADLTSRVETALADARVALQGSKPTEQVRATMRCLAWSTSRHTRE